MIEFVEVHNVASYRLNDPQKLEAAATFNFLYGSNGSGKTTISRLMQNPLLFPDSLIRWKAANRLETLVYNRDFVAQNFVQSSEIRGIFTLGQQKVETLNQIAALSQDAGNLSSQIGQLLRTRDGENGSEGESGRLRNLIAAFTDRCWQLKVKHDRKLQAAFAGVRSDRIKFKNRLLTEKKDNKAQLRSLEYLETKALSVFDTTSSIEALPSLPDATRLIELEAAPVLQRVIVGKADVDISAMIKKLSNSDWVREGISFYKVNDEFCPFCQQKPPETLGKSLEDYFDDAFIRDAQAIDQICSDYKIIANQTEARYQELLNNPVRGLEVDKLRPLIDSFHYTVALNIALLDSKKKEPSKKVILTPLEDVVNKITILTGVAINLIQAHNDLVRNRDAEKARLIDEIWKYLLDNEIKEELASFEQQANNIVKSIAGIDQKIKHKASEKAQIEDEIRKLEKLTTSIEPTIADINADLTRWGFTGFALAKADKNGFYRLVREDGTAVNDSLSEGEKSFVTFLYFYRLLKGSNSESGTVNDRVVVIDDPVSSLDSNVLYVVSSLIRSLFKEIREGSNPIKQIFVLTHNVYFHKEVTYKLQGLCKYWVVRKLGSTSKIESYSSNPIKSSYELLWAELRRLDPSKPTTQNTMRRILETYFKHFGSIDVEKLDDFFDGQDKYLVRSLLSWMHDGSHSIHDDLHISSADSGVDDYFRVFKKIFADTKHGAHYEMMMHPI
ncbi:AAA family ATPase [Tunturibacter psychrotolerans]|uniref:AAA family ATPase n=1 Tax=Tunturiibacter psychrotolerans TaxID=3069686 RepID=A0AAU7ZU56_9BACT